MVFLHPALNYLALVSPFLQEDHLECSWRGVPGVNAPVARSMTRLSVRSTFIILINFASPENNPSQIQSPSSLVCVKKSNGPSNEPRGTSSITFLILVRPLLSLRLPSVIPFCSWYWYYCWRLLSLPQNFICLCAFLDIWLTDTSPTGISPKDVWPSGHFTDGHFTNKHMAELAFITACFPYNKRKK